MTVAGMTSKSNSRPMGQHEAEASRPGGNTFYMVQMLKTGDLAPRQ